jgi:hypothetical protein
MSRCNESSEHYAKPPKYNSPNGNAFRLPAEGDG